jgi:hypothetical protein
VVPRHPEQAMLDVYGRFLRFGVPESLLWAWLLSSSRCGKSSVHISQIAFPAFNTFHVVVLIFNTATVAA